MKERKPMTLPSIEAYETAMRDHGDHVITVEISLLHLTMLVSSLQLALRHPHYPASLRPTVEAFVQDAITNIAQLSPVISAVMQAGNDPGQDV